MGLSGKNIKIANLIIPKNSMISSLKNNFSKGKERNLKFEGYDNKGFIILLVLEIRIVF